MSLTWRDLVATLLTIGAVGITYARLRGFEIPLLGNWRMVSLAVLILGLGACITIGSGGTPEQNIWTTIGTGLGVVGFILATIGIITGSQIAALALTTDIVALWAITTLHHMLTAGA